MSELKLPRFMLAAPASGSGKTTLTCAVLKALMNKGMKTAALKSGPDYIDPMFHSRVIGTKSRNMDLFMLPEETAKYLLAKNGKDCDIAVLEGAMGFFDGMGTTLKGSAYDLARLTQTPVILVVNAKGAALSIAAMIEGFKNFRKDVNVAGAVLNNVTAMSYLFYKEAIEKETGIPLLGYMPHMENCNFESRHLGLVTAGEITGLQEIINTLAAQAEKSIDFDRLLEIAAAAPALTYTDLQQEKIAGVKIAVAYDKAFCFYYQDALELLESLGAQLVYFSPLEDKQLPECDGLYLGGGYPELYAKVLQDNFSMRASIKNAVDSGLPCIAECGGFMYLTEAIGEHPMVGFLPGRCFDAGKLARFGYVTLTAERDNLLCRAGGSIPAHEFHHWDAEQTGDAFTAAKPFGRSWPCVFATDTLYAGYPHFHFYANPSFAVRFLDACRKGKHHAGTDQTDGH